MVQSRSFILLYLMSSLSIFSGFFVLNQTKLYGMANGFTNDQFLALIGSLSAVFNILRFVWSWLLDYYTYRQVYGALLVGQICLNLSLPAVSADPLFYALWVCLAVFCEGGHFTLLPNILKRIFGSKATQLYGILFTYTSLCAVLMILLQNAFLDTASIASFNRFFYLNAALSGGSLFLLMTLFNETKFAPAHKQLRQKLI